MRSLNVLWIFYKKLLPLSLALSILFGFISVSGSFDIKSVGLGIIFIVPFFHFIVYELRNPNEYYFYFNLGFSKLFLWATTATISSIVGLTLQFL